MGLRKVRCFDSTSPEYMKAFHTFLSNTDQKERALAWMESEVSALSQRRTAIDAGAGTGKLTAWLADRFSTVVGIEPNPSLAAQFHSTCPDVDLIPETILDGNPITASDFILCSHVFYYLPKTEWEANLQRLISWLAPGGVLAICIQNQETDCMRMVDHFIGGQFNLEELTTIANSTPGGPYRVRLDTVPARIRATDLPTACEVAEFILNVLPMNDPPTWSDLEEYVAKNFAHSSGYEFSCDQDFLRVESLVGT